MSLTQSIPRPTYEERREALREAIAAGLNLNRLLFVRSILEKLQAEEWEAEGRST